MGLRRVGKPATSLNVGTLVHKGLEAHLRGDDDPIPALKAFAAEKAKEIEEAYFQAVGAFWGPEEQKAAQADVDLAVSIVAHYILYYGKNSLWPLVPVPGSVERTFRVPIPGTDHFLAGTFDALAEHPGTNELWVVDHKTYRAETQYRSIEMGWQFRGYVMAARMLFPGANVVGVLYNGLKNTVPATPKPLKKGGISRAKKTLDGTTYQAYMSAIVSNGLQTADYLDELAYLAEKGNKFFVRHHTRPTTSQMARFAVDLAEAANEMAACRNMQHPTFSVMTCAFCSFQTLCDAIENNEPLPYHKYEPATYSTTESIDLEPETVSGLQDLAHKEHN